MKLWSIIWAVIGGRSISERLRVPAETLAAIEAVPFDSRALAEYRQLLALWSSQPGRELDVALDDEVDRPDLAYDAIWLARDPAGYAAGFLALRSTRQALVIKKMFLLPPAAGEENARRLLQPAMHWVRDVGYDTVWVEDFADEYWQLSLRESGFSERVDATGRIEWRLALDQQRRIQHQPMA